MTNDKGQRTNVYTQGDGRDREYTPPKNGSDCAAVVDP